MPFTDYTAFRSAITSWLDVGDSNALTNTQLDDLIRVAERKIGRKVRVRQNETVLNITMSGGTASVPTNYVELKSSYIDGTPTKKLEKANVDYIYSAYPTRSSTSRPRFIAREGSNFIFGPYPDSDYTVKGIFYKRLPPLNTTLHALFNVAEDLYLWRSCAEAAEMLSHPMLPVFEKKYGEALDELNSEGFAELAGGGMSIRNG